MRIIQSNGREYRLPNDLNSFQEEMYIHLVNRKWAQGIMAPGTHLGIKYDAIIPKWHITSYPMLYDRLADAMQEHAARFPFRPHKHFNHMASSQAANINLFLPILKHPRAAQILKHIKPDMDRIATDCLDSGYQIEFWDGKTGSDEKGLLKDHGNIAGTDADMAIAYYDCKGHLCLWLIEHKLTEKEFTTCGGFRSKGNKERQKCSTPFVEILANKNTCYYHDRCKYEYWNITEENLHIFPGYTKYNHCPFCNGMNQLWRNQLLGLAVEKDASQPYRDVFFSVVRHPRNEALLPTIDEYRRLTGGNERFSAFTSADLLKACKSACGDELGAWIDWYCDFYRIDLDTL